MSNKKKIYAMIALVMAALVVMHTTYDSYAAGSYNYGRVSDGWHTYDEDGNKIKYESVGFFEPAEEIQYPDIKAIDDSKVLEYSEYMKAAYTWNDKTWYEYVSIEASSEVVVVYAETTYQDDMVMNSDFISGVGSSESKYHGKGLVKFMSLGNFNRCAGRYSVIRDGASAEAYSEVNNKKIEASYNCEYKDVKVYHGGFTMTAYEIAVDFGSMKAFSSAESAFKYLTTGEKENMITEPTASKEYDGDYVYLKDFKMIFHDSNSYDACYLEFLYTIPDELKDCTSLLLVIDEIYESNIRRMTGPDNNPIEKKGTNNINVFDYPTGFKLYLDDIEAIYSYVNPFDFIEDSIKKRQIMGTELIIDTKDWNVSFEIEGVGVSGDGEAFMKITNSKLYLYCNVVADGKWGVQYTGNVDFLSGNNDMSSYTPDTDGSYTYNDDYINQGHYYTEVGTDAAGNTTYNYYFYTTDGTKTKTDASGSNIDVSQGNVVNNNSNNINIPDNINVTINGGLSGGSSSSMPDITIEDDDLTFKSLANVMKSGFGIIDDVDTGVKGDGFPAMLAYLYNGLPDDFIKIILLGVSSVTGIAIILRVCNR